MRDRDKNDDTSLKKITKRNDFGVFSVINLIDNDVQFERLEIIAVVVALPCSCRLLFLN